MRIGILTNTYPPNTNGVSVSVAGLEKGLQSKGHQVFIVTPEVKGYEYPENVLPVKSNELPKSVSSDLKVPYFYVNKAKNFFQKNNIEIIHVHDLSVSLSGVIIAEKLQIPSVYTAHTMLQDYAYLNIPGYKTLIRQMNQLICNSYDHIICPSKKIYTYLLGCGVGTPMSRILNVINMEEVLKSDINVPVEKYKSKPEFKLIKSDDFVYISFCRLAKEKNLDLAIESMEPILKREERVKFLIMGDGPYQKDLVSKVSSLGLENKVIFGGKYERFDLKYLAKLAKVFVFTSYSENLPTNIYEAMILGLPVVAVDDSSINYILKHGKGGFRAKNSEQIIAYFDLLYQNQDQLKEQANLAKKSAFKIFNQDSANLHAKLYKRVLEMYQDKRKEYQEKTNAQQLFDTVKNLAPKDLMSRLNSFVGIFSKENTVKATKKATKNK